MYNITGTLSLKSGTGEGCSPLPFVFRMESRIGKERERRTGKEQSEKSLELAQDWETTDPSGKT